MVALTDIVFFKSGYWIFGVKMGDINYLKLGYWDIGPPTAGPYYKLDNENTNIVSHLLVGQM